MFIVCFIFRAVIFQVWRVNHRSKSAGFFLFIISWNVLVSVAAKCGAIWFMIFLHKSLTLQHLHVSHTRIKTRPYFHIEKKSKKKKYIYMKCKYVIIFSKNAVFWVWNNYYFSNLQLQEKKHRYSSISHLEIWVIPAICCSQTSEIPLSNTFLDSSIVVHCWQQNRDCQGKAASVLPWFDF